MESGSGITRAQRIFLKQFCKEAHGADMSHWPAPAVLRRWLRRPTFRAAMRSLLGVMRFQTDFQLASAAATASHCLHMNMCSGDPDTLRERNKGLSDLLKLAHVRERFSRLTHKPVDPFDDEDEENEPTWGPVPHWQSNE
jgi:hypothetical protein